MRQILTVTAVFLTIIAILGGCGGSSGSDSAQIGRARMVGNENLKLKKQLDEKDLEIKDLEQKIADMEAENAKAMQDCGDANLKIMQLMAEKGILSRDTTLKTHIYSPAIPESDTKNHMIHDFINNAFYGSAMDMVMQVLGNAKATPDELQDLKKLIDDMEKQSKA